MSSLRVPEFLFDSPSFFSANWLGRHPYDSQPRLVQCFGPSLPDDFAALQAAVLGLESALQENPPPQTSVVGALEDACLVLSSGGHELLRTDPLPRPLATLLRWRPEVLLVWVDVPLQNPHIELSTVGMQHVWTGLATVQGGDR
jgi:hypothetical protein